jgi:hypothetical protein
LLAGDDLDQNGLPCHGSRAALHDDIQALTFPLNALQADPLVIASDGGVQMTRDLGRCFDSEYSRSLAILQFYGPGHTLSPGTLSVSSRFPGLLAGGTQDNGNVTLHPDSDAGAVWHRLVGGDGGVTRFIDPLAALLHASSGQPNFRLSRWDAAKNRFDGAGFVVPKDGDPAGLDPASLEAVIAPTWGRSGQLLYACAGSSDGHVHGLFADADGGNAEFLLLGRAGAAVSAVTSTDGSSTWSESSTDAPCCSMRSRAPSPRWPRTPRPKRRAAWSASSRSRPTSPTRWSTSSPVRSSRSSSNPDSAFVVDAA